MATRMQGAEVEVKLDTSKAERTVSDLEARLVKMQQQAEKLRKALGAAPASVSGGAPSQGGVSGGTAEKNVANEVVEKVKKGMGGASFGMAVSGGAGGAAAKTLTGKISEGVESILPGGVKLAGAAAAGYLAASTAAKISPIALEAIRAALPAEIGNNPLFRGLETGLEALRNAFTTLESGVKAIFTATGKTADLAGASLRLTGQMPALAPIFDENMKADTQESRLEKKFAEYKQKEVAAGVGESLAKIVKESLSR